MKNFNELSKEGHEGSFTIEPNELTEIHVNWEAGCITVDTYRTKQKRYDQRKSVTTFRGLAFLGGKSLEELFNEALKSL